MQKPKGMSRKDYRNLKAIVREFLNDPSAIVDLSEGTAEGVKFQRHDEGFNARFVQVSLPDREHSLKGGKPGDFLVRVECWGRDCDGRHSNEDLYTVGEVSHRRRFYMGKNWETNRPTGKFEIKGRFQIREKGSSFQRDYTAEAAGY